MIMISNILLDWIRVYHLSPNEKIRSYHFKRELKRDTQRYIFTLQLYIEDKLTAACYSRDVLLGSSPRI